MATLAETHPTLLDVTKRLDPGGKIDKIAEILNETNECLDDAVWLMANDGTSNKTTVRTGLPTPTWRKLYGGVQPTKSQTAQVSDTSGMLEAYAEVDKKLADYNGNTAAFRLSEERPHIEGMSQELADTLWQGNELTEPEAFTGFGPRFALSTGANNSDNVFAPHLGGTPTGSDFFSIWLIGWGPNSAYLFYPNGMKAGLTVEDKGQVTRENADYSVAGAAGGGMFEVYRSHYTMDVGLTVRDWRYVSRYQGVYTDLGYTGVRGTGWGTGADGDDDLIDIMIDMIERMPSTGSTRMAFYMSRPVRTILRKQMTAAQAGNLTWDTVAGKKVMFFDEYPVRRCDSLAPGLEATLTA